ncbi:transcription factor E4F1 isoform X4 [Xenopus laevis]|uniref:Transcription factor E4F1 n=1 Tax=Xenopus laevis TaxID=8355 RepID=A0A8J0TNZ2_XENLA|nr:transcription factor E4F1 isoform X4 [Xenopus laevis]
MSSELGAGAEEAASSAGGLVRLEVPGTQLITCFKEEDEDDVHKCGRCQAEFTSLEEFVHHKIQKICLRAPDPNLVSTGAALNSQEQVVPSIEETETISQVIVESTEDVSNEPDEEVSEDIKDILTSEDSTLGVQRDAEELEVEWDESQGDLEQDDYDNLGLVTMVLNEKGRYVCQLCDKTFKTANILRAHLVTHSTKKEFECKLCGNSFRTKGSLIRHNRRHTDERPYVCSKCGKSFRESGALTRHFRSLTPCTEKIRLNMCKEILISKEEYASGLLKTDGTSESADPMLKCPKCNTVCISANALSVHLKGHEGCMLYTCEVCGREFLKRHLLRKHQECHYSERKYKCGECGKMYKTVAHVKGHMRVHSDDRPYPCPKCGKRYKTKNAQQVHSRTHLDDKPYICQFCPNSFREKGSLIRHVRHHTGERPFKCHKCGRGFAEHGTLNRHLKTKGGCMLLLSLKKKPDGASSTEESSVALTEETTVASSEESQEPHTVLVEFSSVVADTQEYIIETAAEDSETSEAAELIQDTRSQEVDGHLFSVVQQIVSDGSPSQQIIVQNMSIDGEERVEEVPTTDTIAIATPELLTEQVALTLASAMEDGVVVAKEEPMEEQHIPVPEEVEMMENAEEFVIESHNEDLEVQTVIV